MAAERDGFRWRECGAADHHRNCAAEFLDRYFGHAPALGVGLREPFAGGAVDQHAVHALAVIQPQSCAERRLIERAGRGERRRRRNPVALPVDRTAIHCLRSVVYAGGDPAKWLSSASTTNPHSSSRECP
jgi:hypothetical protein